MGYVLAGGKSSRMGRDKALLPYNGAPLAARVAAAVQDAAGAAVLVGDPARYRDLGFPVTPDLLPGCGPLGGIHAALSHTVSEWNLIVACDMPALDPVLLRDLLDAAQRSACQVLLPANRDGLPEPLCGVWRRDALPTVDAAIRRGLRKVAEAAQNLNLILYPVTQITHFANINTPEDWADYAPH